jgi:hypothetical protein
MQNHRAQAKRTSYGGVLQQLENGVKVRFGPEDFLRLRDKHPGLYPDSALRFSAELILCFTSFSDRDGFAARLREVFDAIPVRALEADPTTSDIEAFGRALKFCLALVVFASIGGRDDLRHILQSLHMGVLAVEDRLRGVDEPLLRAKHSPTAGREDQYVKCVKTWSAMAALALVEMGMPRKQAAKKVADVLNRHQFLPPKRSGLTVVPRSVVNWMTRWEDGDLKYFGDARSEFRDAFLLLDQGHAKGAERKLLAILAERLSERRDFQLFPREETSALS